MRTLLPIRPNFYYHFWLAFQELEKLEAWHFNIVPDVHKVSHRLNAQLGFIAGPHFVNRRERSLNGGRSARQTDV